jgi:hypothetical protein
MRLESRKLIEDMRQAAEKNTVVWDIVTRDVPLLLQEITSLLEK